MRETHFSEIRWYSEISTTAFCESLDLDSPPEAVLIWEGETETPAPGTCQCRIHFRVGSWNQFASYLADRMRVVYTCPRCRLSRNSSYYECGTPSVLSKLTALAAAARATNSRLCSVHHEKEKQRIVQYILKDMGLMDYVEFVTEDPSTLIPQREGVEFVLFSGLPERYIELFDLLKLKKGAIVVADNALDDTTNEYIRHVRRQPGVDSSTLPLSRGIEVTKIVTWEEFKAGRKQYGGVDDPINDREYKCRRRGIQGAAAFNAHLSADSLHFSATSDVGSPHCSGFRAKTVLVQPKQKKSESSDSGSESPVNTYGLEGSEPVTRTAAESERREPPHHDAIEEQFKSMQSLADQWRLQLAAQDESSGLAGTSAESPRAVALPEHVRDETASYSTTSEPSVASPQDQASGDLEHENLRKVIGVEDYITRLHWHLPMDLENNCASLPSSNASMAEKVAPEPLEPAEATANGNEERVFQIYFHNENGQTEVTIEGIDQDMLLFDLTLAFNETGISVKRAKISTQDIYVTDVFYVVDGGTKGPLMQTRWDAVRKRILERLAERRELLRDDQ